MPAREGAGGRPAVTNILRASVGDRRRCGDPDDFLTPAPDRARAGAASPVLRAVVGWTRTDRGQWVDTWDEAEQRAVVELAAQHPELVAAFREQLPAARAATLQRLVAALVREGVGGMRPDG